MPPPMFKVQPKRAPFDPPNLKMSVETRWFDDGMIEQRTVDLRGEITLQFMNTKEAHIHKALIALGWKPPGK